MGGERRVCRSEGQATTPSSLTVQINSFRVDHIQQYTRAHPPGRPSSLVGLPGWDYWVMMHDGHMNIHACMHAPCVCVYIYIYIFIYIYN